MMKKTLQKAKQVSFEFGVTSFEERQKILQDLANTLEENIGFILQENTKDLAKMNKEDALYDRMLLTESRIEDIAQACREISGQEDVLGGLLEERDLSCGLHLRKVAVPLGVVACIYEARPNVTIDIAALCLFTGNVGVLRGSSNAEYSNNALVKLIHSVLDTHNIPKEVISQYSTNRDDMITLFEAVDQVDLIIPRGGKGLINRVRYESLVPTIETGAGVCHAFIDESADIDMAVSIVINAKTQRPSVCNALDTCIVHEKVRKEFYEKLLKALKEHKVKIWADEIAFGKFPESESVCVAEDFIWGEEFLGLAMSVKTVGSVDEAVLHINTYGSTHSEAIISENTKSVEKFFNMVDASSLYHNASTRFTDGSVFGMGAEIGISTQKLHARGPMGASVLSTYKYLLEGHGEIRN